MNNDNLASKQNYYTEPVYTEGALHAEPVYTGVQQSWFRMFMNPMFIIMLVCIIF